MRAVIRGAKVFVGSAYGGTRDATTRVEGIPRLEDSNAEMGCRMTDDLAFDSSNEVWAPSFASRRFWPEPLRPDCG